MATVRRLLAAKVAPTSVFRKTTALHVAAAHGRAEVIEAILDHGVAVDFVANGVTALLVAARKGKVAALEVLLNRGASVIYREGNGETALHFAASYDHVKAVQLLVEHGAQMNAVTTRSPLRSALMYTETFKGFAALLDLGADANIAASKYDTETILHAAVRDGKVRAVALLLAHGADPLRVDHNGKTAIELARAGEKSEHREILELLAAPPAPPASPVKPRGRAGKPVHTVLSAVPLSHAGGVTAVAWGGDRIATVGFDNYLRVWDAVSGDALWSKRVSSGDAPFALEFSPDGAVVVSGNKAPSIFDAATGDKLAQGEPNKHRLNGVVVTDTLVVTMTEGWWMSVVDRATGATVERCKMSLPPSGLALSPAGDRVLVVSNEGRSLLSLPDLTPLVEEAGLLFTEFGWDAGGPWVGNDGRLLRLDPTTLAVRSETAGIPGRVYATAGNAVITWEREGRVRLIDPSGPTVRAEWPSETLFACRASRSGDEFAVACGRGIHVRDARTGQVRLGAPRSLLRAREIALDPDGSVVAWDSGWGSALYRWGGTPAIVDPPRQSRQLVAIVAGGPVWWVAEGDADALVFCARSGEELRRLALPTELRGARAVLSPDGGHLLARDDQKAWSMDLESGKIGWTANAPVCALAPLGNDGFAYAVGRRVHIMDRFGVEQVAFDVALVSFGELIELRWLPARDWIACLLGNDVRVHDRSTGAEVAWYPSSKASGGYSTSQHGCFRMASDDEARRLAIVAFDRVQVWNLDTHKEEPALTGAGSLDFGAMWPDGTGFVAAGAAGVVMWTW